MSLPTLQDILDARKRIQGMVHKTPVLTSSTLNALVGAEVFLKCEQFQRMGAYKMRGASHAISRLSEEQLRQGVVTHSSGNFAQAIALAAKIKGIKAIIVMPENAPMVKVKAVEGYGATIVTSGNTPKDREHKVKDIIAEHHMTFIHPSNHLDVILGNSTCAQELIEEVDHLDIIIAPVGGGGLLAGTALAAHYLSPQTVVWAAEPEQADDAYRSLQSGKIEINSRADTIADGLRTNLGDINFPMIHAIVKRVLLVSESEILDAMWWVWERMKTIIEPSSAVAVAAVMRYKDEIKDKRVGVVISGGNADIVELVKIKLSAKS